MLDLPNCNVRGHNHKLVQKQSKWLHCPSDNYRWEPMTEKALKWGLPQFIAKNAITWNGSTYARHKKPHWGW